MSEYRKNEVDLLLRALGREAGKAVPGDALGTHLDPDELSSFAENVLPEATRMRYASHLADCSDCRRLVTQLSQAAGLPRLQPIEKQERSFWAFFSALFSPLALRYAIPALALVAIAAIGLFALRERSRPDLVAQKTETSPTPTNVALEQREQSTAELHDSSSTASKPAPQPSVAANDKSGTKKADSSEAAAQTGQVSETVSVAEEEKPAPAPQVAAAQPSYAPEPKTEAKTNVSPLPTSNDAAAEGRGARRREQGERDEDARSDDSNAPKDGATPRSLQGLRTISPAKRGGSGPQKNEESLAKEKQAKTSSEVRSVAGRQFRKEGNSWIDTAYEEGRATVIVKRGSEQYRALVADEPQLQTVAESLHGTVVVVWKGRAYRFQ
jgi:putative zinc finger protein